MTGRLATLTIAFHQRTRSHLSPLNQGRFEFLILRLEFFDRECGSCHGALLKR